MKIDLKSVRLAKDWLVYSFGADFIIFLLTNDLYILIPLTYLQHVIVNETEAVNILAAKCTTWHEMVNNIIKNINIKSLMFSW